MRELWLFMAEEFDNVRWDDGLGDLRTPTYQASSICNLLYRMRFNPDFAYDMIRKAEDAVDAAVMDCKLTCGKRPKHWPWLFPKTEDGMRQRAEFCRKMADQEPEETK